MLTETDGGQYKYTTSPGYVGELNVKNSTDRGTLYYNFGAATWELQRNNLVYKFKSNGYLGWLSRGGKNLYTYAWTGSNMTSITNAAGVAITFGWTNGKVTSVSDPAGKVWTYAYNGNGMLYQVTAPGSPADVRTYHYEHTGDATLLTGVSVNGVRRTNYSYYADKRVYQSGPVDGEDFDTISYGSNTATVSTPKSPATTYTFADVQGELRTVAMSRSGGTTCPGASAATAYDTNGYVDYTDDWNGHRTDYTYDVNGRLTQQTAALGTSSALTTAHTWSGRNITKTEYKDRNGAVYATVIYSYHTSGYALGELATETWTDRTGAQRQISYTWTYHPSPNTGRVKTHQTIRSLPGGTPAISTVEYDIKGNVIKSTNPVGHITQWSGHDGMGRAAQMTDANNVVTTFVHHDNGNLLSATTQLPTGNRTVTYAYNNTGQVTDIAYPTGRIDRFRYNAAGRLTQTGDALGKYVTRDFNVSTKRETISSPRNVPSLSGSVPVPTPSGVFSSSMLLDCDGRPCVANGSNGQQVTLGYDGAGNVTSRTDAVGRVTTYQYDALHRPIQSQAPDGGITDYRYDAEGRLWQVEDPRNLITTYTYNGFGNLLTQTSPDTGLTQYAYDSAGRLQTQTPANGVTVSFGWDALGRMTSRTAGGATETFTYDQGSHGIGRLTAVVNASGHTEYGYGPDGQLILQETKTFDTVQQVEWGYDAAGRVTSMVYPDGTTLDYNYDSVGRLSSISRWTGSNWAVVADNFLYQPATDKPYAWRFGNQLTSLMTLDSDDRLTHKSSPNVHALSLAYTAELNTLRSVDDGVYPSQSSDFNYDDNDRLSAVTRSGDNQAFVLDAAGNRGSHTRASSTALYGYYPGSHRLQSVSGSRARSFAYNAVGDLSSESGYHGSRTYAYDTFQRLNDISVGGAFVGRSRYNGLNQRVWKNETVAGINNSTYFVPAADGRLLYERKYGSGGHTTAYVWFGTELLGIVRGGQFYANHNDHLGRPEMLSNASQQIVWRANNAAFDRQVLHDTIGGFNLGFPGQYYDTATELWQNWHRFYDAQIGRYLQSDPIGLAGGINTYTYVGGNPISYVDPTGLNPALLLGCGAGLVGGFLAGDQFVKSQADRHAAAKGGTSSCEGKAGDTNPGLVDGAGKVADAMNSFGKVGTQGVVAAALIGAGAKTSGFVGIGCSAVGGFLGAYFGTGDVTRAMDGIKGVQIIIKGP